MDIAAAKALLQRKEGNGSVYDHLTEVILRILTEQPSNALAAFEQVSATVKAAAYPAAAPGGRVGGDAANAELQKAVLARLKKDSELLKAPGSDEEEGAAASGEPVQDIVEDAHFLEWAGFSLGKTATFRLHMSMKHLAAKVPVRNLRFWGKLLGTAADYFVLQGEMDPEGDEADDAKDALGNTLQKTGEGPNKFVYFVSHSIGKPADWIKLPNVTPHQIVVARKIRQFLTGNLDSPVNGHPPFPGKERNYIRAVIALITAGTAVAPSGMFNPVEDDENGNIQPNEEEWEGPDLSQLDSWVHTSLDLNVLGRTKANPPKVGDDGEEIEDPDAPEPSTPLKPITDDAPVVEDAEEGGGSWDVKQVPTSGTAEGESTGLAVLRSLRWPGAFTVGFGKGKRFASVYIGWGHEVLTKPYEPHLPAALPTEFEYLAADTLVREQPDVDKDPDEGKEAEEGDEEES